MNGPTFAFASLTVAALVWLLVALALRIIFDPRRPREGPMTSELREEPPAVVNLLTHAWCVTASAAAATVVDLANRRYIEIVQVTPEQDVIEIRQAAKGARDLQPYERQVLDHLRHRAVGGVVPATALTTGPTAVSDAWWARFRRAVEKDARRRGLSRRRFAPGLLVAMGIAAGGLVLWLFLAVSATKDAPANEGARLWSILAGAGLVGLCVVVATRFDRDRQRDTDAGLAAASHWLGVRRGYADVGRYPELPPAAVVLYERHLGYAAAMDVATRTIARLPLSAEDDRLAWSHHGDHWRQVEVVYPTRRVGWGEGPGRAIVGGLLWTATLLVPLAVLVKVGTDLLGRLEDAARSVGQVTDPASRIYDEVTAHRIALGVTWVIGLVLATITILAIRRGLVRMVRGLIDAGRENVVRGTVVRRRTWPRQRGTESVEVHWIAVDDGSTDRIRAFVARRTVAAVIRQDDEVELRITPFLGFVRSATVTRAQPALAPARSVDQLVRPTLLPPVHWIERLEAANGTNGHRYVNGTNGNRPANGSPLAGLARQLQRLRPTKSSSN